MDYDEFRHQYSKQHPGEEPRKPPPVRRSIFLRAAVMLAFLAVALISGVHTVPAVYQGIPKSPILPEWVRVAAAYGSFIAVELSILLAAYLIQYEKWLARLTVAISALIAIAANVASLAQRYGTESIGTALLTYLFGMGIPVMAFAMGSILLYLNMSERRAHERELERYQAAVAEWNKNIRAAYARLHRQTKSAPSAPSVYSRQTAERQQTVSDAMIEYLKNNPDALEAVNRMKLREAAQYLNTHGIEGNKDTVSKARRMLERNGNEK